MRQSFIKRFVKNPGELGIVEREMQSEFTYKLGNTNLVKPNSYPCLFIADVSGDTVNYDYIYMRDIIEQNIEDWDFDTDEIIFYSGNYI